MTRQERRAAIYATFLILCGLTTALLTMCATASYRHPRGGVGAAHTETAAMGYVNGEACFHGNCKSASTLLDCAACCAQCTTGMEPAEKERCIELCVEHHGGAGKAFDQLIASGETIRQVHNRPQGTDISSVCDPVTYQKHRHFVRVMRSHPNRTLSRFAGGLVRQLDLEAVES